MKNKVIRRAIRIVKSWFEYVSKEQKDKLQKIEVNFPRVMTTEETLIEIKRGCLSIARYGDAEFDICNQENKEDEWQKPNDKLTKRLKEILAVEEEGFLTCIPPYNSKYNNIKNYYGSLSFWQYYWLNKYDKIRPLLVRSKYGNSFVSRDAVFYENDIESIKGLWNNRKVVFVYGKGGRFKENSFLFERVKKVGTVYVDPTNAFARYDDIIAQCVKYEKDILFLIAAGPTASVLAYDLFKRGYQALDIGHIPNCYEQYKGLIISPESLPLNNNQQKRNTS